MQGSSEAAMCPSIAPHQTSFPSLSSTYDEEEAKEDFRIYNTVWGPEHRTEVPWRESTFFKYERWYPDVHKYNRWVDRRVKEDEGRNLHMFAQLTWNQDYEEIEELRKAAQARRKFSEISYRLFPVKAQQCKDFERGLMMLVKDSKEEALEGDYGKGEKGDFRTGEDFYTVLSTDSWDGISERRREDITQWSRRTLGLMSDDNSGGEVVVGAAEVVTDQPRADKVPTCCPIPSLITLPVHPRTSKGVTSKENTCYSCPEFRVLSHVTASSN